MYYPAQAMENPEDRFFNRVHSPSRLMKMKITESIVATMFDAENKKFKQYVFEKRKKEKIAANYKVD